MIRYYFSKEYQERVTGLLESFSILHGQKSFELSFPKIDLAQPWLSMIFTDLEAPSQFKISNSTTLIRCGLFPPPPFLFSTNECSIVKGELTSFLAHLLAGSRSIIVFEAKVPSYSKTLLSPITSMLEDTDPGPVSASEVLKQEVQVKRENEITDDRDINKYLDKLKLKISEKLEKREIKAIWEY